MDHLMFVRVRLCDCGNLVRWARTTLVATIPSIRIIEYNASYLPFFFLLFPPY